MLSTYTYIGFRVFASYIVWNALSTGVWASLDFAGQVNVGAECINPLQTIITTLVYKQQIII